MSKPHSPHPLLDPEIFIPHPAHGQFERVLSDWIASDREHAWIWGVEHCGKSTSAEHVARRSVLGGPEVARFCLIRYADSRSNRPATFWCNVLQSLGVAFAPKAPFDHLYASVLGFLRERAAYSPGQRVTLLVDESDSLMAAHHEFLDLLHGDLKCAGCRPLTVFLGSQPPAICRRVGQYQDDANLTRRVRGAVHRMYGLRSREEVESVLEWIYQLLSRHDAFTEKHVEKNLLRYSLRENAGLFWRCYERVNPRARREGWTFGDFFRIASYLALHAIPKGVHVSEAVIQSVLFDGDQGEAFQLATSEFSPCLIAD